MYTQGWRFPIQPYCSNATIRSLQVITYVFWIAMYWSFQGSVAERQWKGTRLDIAVLPWKNLMVHDVCVLHALFRRIEDSQPCTKPCHALFRFTEHTHLGLMAMRWVSICWDTCTYRLDFREIYWYLCMVYMHSDNLGSWFEELPPPVAHYIDNFKHWNNWRRVRRR